MPLQSQLRQSYSNKPNRQPTYNRPRDRIRNAYGNQASDPWIGNSSPKKRGGSLENEIPYPVKRLETSQPPVSLKSSTNAPKKSCLKQSSSMPKNERMVSFNSIVSYHETWSSADYDRITVPMANITWKDMMELRLMRFEATRQAFASVGLALPPTPPLPSVTQPPSPASTLDSIAESIETLSLSEKKEIETQKHLVQNQIETPAAVSAPESVSAIVAASVEENENQKPAAVVNSNVKSSKPFTWNVAAAAFTMPEPQFVPVATPEIIYQNEQYRHDPGYYAFQGPAPYFIQMPTYGFNYQYGFGAPTFSPYVSV